MLLSIEANSIQILLIINIQDIAQTDHRTRLQIHQLIIIILFQLKIQINKIIINIQINTNNCRIRGKTDTINTEYRIKIANKQMILKKQHCLYKIIDAIAKLHKIEMRFKRIPRAHKLI